VNSVLKSILIAAIASQAAAASGANAAETQGPPAPVGPAAAAPVTGVQSADAKPESPDTRSYDEQLLAQPGPAALYDYDTGEPQSLLPVPRDVVFPRLNFSGSESRLRARKSIYDKYGLTFAVSYQQLTQFATETVNDQPQWALGGWLATGMTWTPVDRDGPYQGTMVLRAGWRGPIGDNPWPAPFGPVNAGLTWSNFEFTSWNGYRIEEFFWEQRLGSEFTFRIGNQAPQAIINTFRFKDARTSFTASPLAFGETIPYPAFGAGLSFRWRPAAAPGVFVNGVMNDMNGNPGFGSLNWGNLDKGQFFYGLEVGKVWRRANGEFDLLAINIFHADTRSTFSPDTTPNQAGGGFKVLGEKQWGQIVAFASYVHNTARGGGISTTFSGNTVAAGVARLRPFGIRGEVAIGGMWTQPFDDLLPGISLRNQYGVQSYWNIAVTPNSTMTPAIQLIVNPSFNPTVDFLAIPSLTFRIAL
jgi:hypothetical protein